MTWLGESRGRARWKLDLTPANYRHLLNPKALTPSNPLRVIAHCDIDAAYAQFEAVRIGSPDDVPLIVVQWETIIAVNYPARKYGIKRISGMGPKEAKELCPHLVIVHTATYRPGESESGYWDDANVMTHKVSLDPYRKESAKIIRIFRELVPKGEVEKASIDEAYMDLTPMVIDELLARFPHLATLPTDAPLGDETPLPAPPPVPWPTTVNLIKNSIEIKEAEGGEHEDASEDEGDAVEREAERPSTWSDWALFMGSNIMAAVRGEVWKRLHYTCSAGVAHSKAMAKLCSSERKPDGQTLLRHSAVPPFLRLKAFTDIRNLGGKLGRAIADEYHAETVGELLKVPLQDMQDRFGEESLWVYNIIRGIDETPLTPRYVNKTMLASKNIIPGVFHADEALPWIDLLAGELNVRLLEARDFDDGLWPKTLGISWRVGFGYGNNLRSRQMGFPFTKHPDAEYIAKLAKRMWKEVAPQIATSKGVMDVHNLSLQFMGVERLEEGQRKIEGFFGQGSIASPSRAENVLKREISPPIAIMTDDEDGEELDELKWKCRVCELEIEAAFGRDDLLLRKQEHQDYHLAVELQGDIPPIESSSPRRIDRPARKKLKPNGIRAFFKPK